MWRREFPGCVIGTALIVWRPTEFAALLGVAVDGVRAGTGRLGRAASSTRSWRALRGAPGSGGALERDVPQLQRPLRVLRSLQRRHRRRPQRAGRARSRSLRRRTHPRQGGAVPPPVRSRARIPVDGRGRVRSTCPDPEPCRGGSERRGRWPSGRSCCPDSRWSSSVATQYAAIEDTLWAFAVLGGVLSMLQIVVYSVLARQARKSVLLLWFGLVAVVALGSLADDLRRTSQDRAHGRRDAARRARRDQLLETPTPPGNRAVRQLGASFVEPGIARGPLGFTRVAPGLSDRQRARLLPRRPESACARRSGQRSPASGDEQRARLGQRARVW